MLMFHCLRSLTTLLFQMTKRHLRLLFIIIVFSAFITLQASAITDPRDGVWFMHCHPEAPYQLGLKMGWAVMDGKRPNQKLPPPPSDLPKC